MKLSRIPVMLFFLLFLSSYRLPALFAQNTPAEGDMFPDLKLPLPPKMQEREYLKIDRGPFLLSQIDSKVLIVEIFSIYCPICQKEAPIVNWLFRAISANPELESRVKVLAIGAGNSLYEIDAFRNLFKVKFPLIPDADFSVLKYWVRFEPPIFLSC